MCGIFGFVTNKDTHLTENQFQTGIKYLFKLSERRGREASGISFWSNHNIRVFKQSSSASKLTRNPRFSSLLSQVYQDYSIGVEEALAYIGHSRLVTSGSQILSHNNQPIITNNITGVHNGIITNEDQWRHKLPSAYESSLNDSGVLFSLIDHYLEEFKHPHQALSHTYNQILGSASIAFFRKGTAQLFLATNTGSLYYYHSSNGVLVFGSEYFIVHSFLKKLKILPSGDNAKINQLKSLSGAVFDFNQRKLDVFHLKNNPISSSLITLARPKFSKIIDESSRTQPLIRCSRCILPHTYPFIKFDEYGVCNYCKRYQKQVFKGKEALETILSKYRSKDGKPDCIVGFSGGRDSSYGLHIIKTQLGMNPIAYTYDWATVTNLARENQSRIVSALGIEHIIRAADIHKKRRYIRKNIYAWLKRPHLGMVPLFIVGDKPFYYYGRQLRCETGLKFTIFCAGNQVEQMEFKIGFCGIEQPLQNNQRAYSYSWFARMKLALWYASQYALNPSYLNESLLDSIFGFYSMFINKDDYLYLYEYIPWDESLIEKTLKNEYEWKSDEKYGSNQWRMGDGHTAFVDYVYYTVAGFSEFDDFRSNQIREGYLTRDEALKLTEKDNQPRMHMLQEFSQLIGFNLEEVLLRINEIPKLY